MLDAAAQVISRNPDRAAVELFSDFAEQVRLDIHHTPTDRAEAETIVHAVERMVGGTSYFSLDSGRVDGRDADSGADSGAEAVSEARSFGDFAVLYRLHAQAAPLIEAFERSGIPYQCAGGTSLYARSEVRALLAWLWLLHTPSSRLHWEAAVESLGVSLAPAALDEAWAKGGESSAARSTQQPRCRLCAPAHESGCVPRRTCGRFYRRRRILRLWRIR